METRQIPITVDFKSKAIIGQLELSYDLEKVLLNCDTTLSFMKSANNEIISCSLILLPAKCPNAADTNSTNTNSSNTFIFTDTKKVLVQNSMDDPRRKIVHNTLCQTHGEIIVFRPSVDPTSTIGIIEIKKCKCGCWDE